MWLVIQILSQLESMVCSVLFDSTDLADLPLKKHHIEPSICIMWICAVLSYIISNTSLSLSDVRCHMHSVLSKKLCQHGICQSFALTYLYHLALLHGPHIHSWLPLGVSILPDISQLSFCESTDLTPYLSKTKPIVPIVHFGLKDLIDLS